MKMTDFLVVWLNLVLLLFSYTSAYGINTILKTFSEYIDRFDKSQNHYYYGPDDINLDDIDFVIVGSGSAGSVLANRLSEINDWKILLLEAGRPENTFTEVPLGAPILQATPFNWNYTMERQEGICLGMEDQLCAWPRGRALGGSTVINYMIYTRGNPHDYQKWEANGNPGWSYEEVLPYYLKSENCKLGETCFGKYHNQGGYLNVDKPFSSAISDAFLSGGLEMGEKIVDYNSADFFGYSRIQANLRKGRRVSAANAFLYPILHRKNLKIILSARVSRVIIDPVTKTALGVEFYKKGKIYSVKAKKEVILSAGTFHSPQLLMLSGIGPKEHLNELQIPVLQDLPVGKTMYDHISNLGIIFTMNVSINGREKAIQPQEMLNYLVNGQGIFTSLGGVESLAYIKTKLAPWSEQYPDIELILSGIGSLESDLGIFSRPTLRIKRSLYREYFKPIEDVPCWAILPMLLHPKSKGYLKLRSKHPFDRPMFYGNFFTDPENLDLKTMIESIRYIQRLAQTSVFQQLGSKLYTKPLPNCKHLEFDSDNYWECVLRTLTVTLHHQIGTCKMGPRNDPEAVVDNRLRVYGIKHLRVSDCSVIPVTLSAHTSAPGMMIGEKTADLIKEDWNS